MRILKFVSVSTLSLFVLACAPVTSKKPQNQEYVTEKFSIVSIDLSICGIYGTLPIQGEMELSAEGFINFVIIDPIDKNKVYSKSEFLMRGLNFAFKFQDYPLIGTMRQEDRTDGQYLIFNIPADFGTIKYAELELEHYRLNKTVYLSYDWGLLIEGQEKKIENLKRGFDWVFKKK